MATRCRMIAPGGQLAPETFTAALLGRADVLIAVAGRGVCHADLGCSRDGVRTSRPPPLTLNHEIRRRMVDAGPDVDAWRGKGTICISQKVQGSNIEGGFACRIAVPARRVWVAGEARAGFRAFTEGAKESRREIDFAVPTNGTPLTDELTSTVMRGARQ